MPYFSPVQKEGGMGMWGFVVRKLLRMCFVCLVSCEYHIEELEPVGCPDVSFTDDVWPIIQDNCIQCHVPPLNLLDFTDAAVVVNNADRIKFAVETGYMPYEGSLTDEEIMLILCWADLNNER